MNYADRLELDRDGTEIAAITHGHSLGYIPAAMMTHIISIGCTAAGAIRCRMRWRNLWHPYGNRIERRTRIMIRITHHVEFDFKDREASDLEKLNRVLSAMKLKDLKLENPRGYLAVTKDGDGNLVHQRYGLDSGIFICTTAKDGYCYQIDTAVVDHSVDHDEFLDIWRSCHPDRAIRTVITMDFDEAFGFIILHHQHV